MAFFVCGYWNVWGESIQFSQHSQPQGYLTGAMINRGALVGDSTYKFTKTHEQSVQGTGREWVSLHRSSNV